MPAPSRDARTESYGLRNRCARRRGRGRIIEEIAVEHRPEFIAHTLVLALVVALPSLADEPVRREEPRRARGA